MYLETTYLYLSISFIVSFVLSVIFLRITIKYAYKKRIFDVADNRRVHVENTPRLGGLSFFPAIFIAQLFTFFVAMPLSKNPISAFTTGELLISFSAFLILYAEGLIDDFHGLWYLPKLLAQFVSAVLMISLISSIHPLTDLCGLFLFVGSVFFVVFAINAFNLIDGIDGLSSGLSIIALVAFCIIFLWQGNVFYASLDVAALACMLVFVYFNIFGKSGSQNKIFMGDSGSQFLGFLLSLFLVQEAFQPSLVHNNSVNLVMAVSVFIIPVFDAARVMFGRIFQGKNPFQGDKTHIHHKFLQLGYTHLQSAARICLIAILFIFLNLLFRFFMNVFMILVIDLIVWSIINIYLNQSIKRKHMTIYNKKQNI